MLTPTDYVFVKSNDSHHYNTIYTMISVLEYECCGEEFFTLETFPYSDLWKLQSSYSERKVWVFDGHNHLVPRDNDRHRISISHDDRVEEDAANLRIMMAGLVNDGDSCTMPNLGLLLGNAWTLNLHVNDSKVTKRGNVLTRSTTKNRKVQPYYDFLMRDISKVLQHMLRPLQVTMINAGVRGNRLQTMESFKRITTAKKVIDHIEYLTANDITTYGAAELRWTKLDKAHIRNLFKNTQATMDETGTVKVLR